MNRRSIVIIGVIIGLLASSFLHGQGSLEIRAASNTAIAGWQLMPAPGGRTVWVSPTTALTSTDIARAEPRTDAKGERTVGVVFTEPGARKMAQLSAAQANQHIALLLDGKVVWVPLVRSTIEKEAVLSGVTPDVVQRVLTSIKQ
jgi:preprotein translocase subunit SecD